MSGMKLRLPKHLWFWLLASLPVAFLVIAAVGWMREKHDIRTNQERFHQRALEFREKAGQIQEGDSLTKVLSLFPGSDRDLVDGSGQIEISGATDYEESPTVINVVFEVHRLNILAGKVQSINTFSGMRHGDRFGTGGIFYYFKRAWYSTQHE
ncbi:MAG: hypothetical protein B9S38_01965 [Verrucomicrobiia bacterium Tous-C4TDCM]|nr:MAG: hypothetical protein B9S38_01965 [Verrucomicrobiae bacterium Tous-C4TDCM]